MVLVKVLMMGEEVVVRCYCKLLFVYIVKKLTKFVGSIEFAFD